MGDSFNEDLFEGQQANTQLLIDDETLGDEDDFDFHPSSPVSLGLGTGNRRAKASEVLAKSADRQRKPQRRSDRVRSKQASKSKKLFDKFLGKEEIEEEDVNPLEIDDSAMDFGFNPTQTTFGQ